MVAFVRHGSKRHESAAFEGFVLAFRCRRCGRDIGDGLYVGPPPHAPREVCFGCWVEALADFAPNWRREVVALWLLASGYGRAEAARAVGVSDRTLRNWMIRLHADPDAARRLVEELELPEPPRSASVVRPEQI
jgi:hypothetical protein